MPFRHYNKSHKNHGKKIRWFVCVVFLSSFALAETNNTKFNQLGLSYFLAWQATQTSDAKESDVDAYLSFLTSDVGHQHLPYDKDDKRKPGNRDAMKKGMMFYLASHTEYKSTLTEVVTGHDVIVLQYDTFAKGIHPQSKQEVVQEYQTTEVLELENGKISVIRKYSE